MERLVVSLDPGKDKCGLAVVTDLLEVKYKKVVSTVNIEKELEDVLAAYSPEKILVGSGTFSRKIRERIRNMQKELPLEVVDERHSTEEARRKYFRENPPRGLWWFIPTTLQVPREPVDDYAAVVLAEKYFIGKKGSDVA